MLWMVLAGLATLSSTGMPFDDADLLLCWLAPLAAEVLHRVGPSDDYEAAAFVVQGEDGSLSLLHWPAQRTVRTAQWPGPVPADVVAVIHSHPAKQPRPSRQDVAEATRLGVPFYVVSRGAFCRADTDGDVRCARTVPWA